MRLLCLCSSLILSLSAGAFAQQTTGAIRSTKAICASNNTGNNSHVTINCTGIGKEQGQEIIKLINKALARQDPTEALERLNEKADEILSAVNPNKSVTTYDCYGVSSTVGPSADGPMSVAQGRQGENEANRQTLNTLRKRGNWNGLLKAANTMMSAEPKWLAPQLFAAVATERLGQKEKARQLLDRFDFLAGGAYDQPPCNVLRRQLLTDLSKP